MSRKCLNSPDSFCYICGELTVKAEKTALTPLVKKAYNFYFGCKVGNQDKKWAPHICCQRCLRLLHGWIKGDNFKMPFYVPMVW